MQAETAESMTLEVSAYRHIDKPEWGAAVVAWELDAKRGYQFEDGKLRVFKEGYFHLLTPVLLPSDRGAILIAQARRGVANAEHARDPQAGPIGVTLDLQIDHLLVNYPGGFVAEKWQLEHRDGGKHPLKRHRGPVLEQAQSHLSSARLDEWLSESGAHQGWEGLRDLLAGTDLVPVPDVKMLTRVAGLSERNILDRLKDLLWEKTPFTERFDLWIGALSQGMKRPPSWALATAPLALVQPQEHVCVRPASFETQAIGLSPAIRLRLGKRPNAAAYHRALAMVTRVNDRLVDRGVPPTDLLDVSDFIWATLRPSARAQIEARIMSS